MEKREKRKWSIAVKSIEVPSGREFVEVFEDFWKFILDPDEVLHHPDNV